MTTKELFSEKINTINLICTKKHSEYKLYYEKIKILEKIVSDYVYDLSNFINSIETKEKYITL